MQVRRPGSRSILVRGLVHRAGPTLAILLIATFASAVAGVGPAYYASAKTSMLHDAFNSALVLERGVEVVDQGTVTGSAEPLRTTVERYLDSSVPDRSQRARLFARPIQAIEASASIMSTVDVPLDWRTDYCAHLRITAGHCATSANSVVVSQSLAASQGLHVGQLLHPPGWPTLTVAGIYHVGDFRADYWFARGTIYFPVEDPSVLGAVAYDAMFTPRATVDDAAGDPQGTVVLDQPFATGRIRAADLPALTRATTRLPDQLGSTQDAVSTALPAVVQDVHASWRSLAVPLFLIVVQVLLLVLLMMFFVVRDAIDARAPEIGLARLRGRHGARLAFVALSEPVLLLVVALPVGVLLGRVGTAVLRDRLLLPGTPVGIPALSWIAAGAATVGGLVAVVVAGWRTIRRPVIEQWQSTAREGVRRGWVFDAVVGTAALAGVVELVIGGDIHSVRSGSLGFVVPGLIGLLAAVLATRLVPLACRAAFTTTRRHGGLASFLAVRHLARRAAAARTTFLLALAFALAGFAVIAWSAGNEDRRLVGQVDVGAPVVFDVRVPDAADLGAIVDRVDPSGRDAAVVDSYPDGTTSGISLLAVDPSRFAAVAAWRSGFASRPLDQLMRSLTPPVAPTLTVAGTAMRIRLDVDRVDSPIDIAADLESTIGDGRVYEPLGSITHAGRAQTLTASLSGCPCRLSDLGTALLANTHSGAPPGTTSIDIRGIDVLGPHGWATVDGSDRPAEWRPAVDSGAVTGSSAPVGWTFTLSPGDTATLDVADVPSALPAVVSPNAGGGPGGRPLAISGLDTNQLLVAPVAVTQAVPGAVDGGIIVDRVFAERAANGEFSGVVARQVWTTAAAAAKIRAGLRRAGIGVVDEQSAAHQVAFYDRQGPGLASDAFVGAAGAAALLGAAAAVLGLVSTARRRRYEYTALRTVGASRRTLFSGVLAEQSVVVIAGVVTGVAGAVVAALLAVPSLPEFVTAPSSPPLRHHPAVAELVLYAVLVLALLVVVVIGSTWVLLAGARADDLRGEQL